MKPLTKEFYNQPTLTLAKSLLGCLLVKETADGITSGFVVETEAYMGPHDRAAHSYGNRRTKRTEVMFGEAGYAYVYQMHTHHLVNVVSNESEKPEAVLIRALEPHAGIHLMYERRHVEELKNLTNGPGKLTQAMGITVEDYSLPFFEKPLYFAKGYEPHAITEGKRIGIPNSGEAKDYPWRFLITGNEFVSK